MRIQGFLAAVLACAVFTTPVRAEEAEWLFRGEQAPVDHVVNGYAQTVLALSDGSWKVHVSFSESPIGSNSQAPPLRSLEKVPASFCLPQSLEKRIENFDGAWERATEILRWVSSEIRVSSDEDGPQDAVSVLRRGSGRCSGIANATAALFMAAGYDARTISGLLLTERGMTRHRWLEVFLPGAGWVPTDPTLGYWVITPRHVVFDRTVEDLPQVETIQAPGDDTGFGLMDGKLLRPDRGSDLRCRIIGECPFEILAVLSNEHGDERRTLLNPEGVFSGLLPGRWKLELFRGHRMIRRMPIDVKKDGSNTLAVKLGRQDCS